MSGGPDRVPRGRFITLEGGEGAGKSTQSARLCRLLRARGLQVLETREPGGTPGADALRTLLVTGDTDRWDAVSEALMMYAARRDHVQKVIRPALDGGCWVVCDRFSDSTMAYQGFARGLGRDWVADLDRLALDGFEPDVTLLLDLSPEQGLARAKARGGPDRFERLGAPFHAALRAAFLDIAAQAPARIAIIDASGEPDDVEARIAAALSDRLPLPPVSA